MSAATLFCWQTGHGLSLETRAGIHEVVAMRDGTVRRLVNACRVDEWPGNSRTAQRLEELFQKYWYKLVKMNQFSHDTNPEAYRALFWEIKADLKGE